MEPTVALQIWMDEDRKKDDESELFSENHQATVRDTGGMKTTADPERQCNRATSSSCSIGAPDVITGSCKAGFIGRPAEPRILSHLLRCEAAELEVRECVEETRFTNKMIGMHHTMGKRGSLSGKLLSDKVRDYHRPLRRQHSLPEEVLFVAKEGSNNFLYPRYSAKTYRRSVTFPLERERLDHSGASGTSLASLATAASSSAAPSSFSSFVGQRSSVTSLFRSGELEGFLAAQEKQECSKFSGKMDTSAYEKLAGSVDELSIRHRFSSSLSANVKTRLFGSKPHNLTDDEYDPAHVQDIYPSIQGSYKPCMVVCNETIAPSCLSGQCSPQRKVSPEVLPAETCEVRKCTSTISSLSKMSYPSHLRLPSHNEVTRSPSSSRCERPCSLQAHTGRVSLEANNSPWCSQLQRATNAESCDLRTYGSAPSCSGSIADGDTSAEKSVKEEDSTIKRMCSEPYARGKTTVEGLSGAEAVRSRTSPPADGNRCPNAPLLTCALSPCSHIPELELADGLMVLAADPPDTLPDSKQVTVASSRAVETPPQRLIDNLSKLKMPEFHSFQSTAICSDVRTSFSYQLQQALCAVANPDGDTTALPGTRKHSREDS